MLLQQQLMGIRLLLHTPLLTGTRQLAMDTDIEVLLGGV